MIKYSHIYCITNETDETAKLRRTHIRKWARKHKIQVDWVFITAADGDKSAAHMKCISLAAKINPTVALIMEDCVLIEQSNSPTPTIPSNAAMLLLEHNIFNLHPSQHIPPPASPPTWLHTISTAAMPRAYIILPRIISQIDKYINSPSSPGSIASKFCAIQVSAPTYSLHPAIPTSPPTPKDPMIQTCLFTIVDNTSCQLTLKTHPRNTLPTVSVVVPTYNRHKFIPQIKYNIRRQTYPAHLIQLIIVDDSTTTSPISITWPPGTIYHHLSTRHNISAKRNIGATLATGKIIVHMDDDDVYFPEYISTAVNVLMDNPHINCVGSTSIGCYNLNDKSSFISGSVVSYFAEASMVYRKSFWEERPFDTTQISGEGIPFIYNRFNQCMQIPFLFTMIAITHKDNMTPNRKLHTTTQPPVGGDDIWNLIPPDSQLLLRQITGTHT